MSEAFNDLDVALRDKVFLEKGVPININYRLTLQKIYSDSDSGLGLFLRYKERDIIKVEF